MFFYLSKAAFFVLRPSNFLILLLVAGLLLWLFRRRRSAAVLIVLGTMGLVVDGLSPLANWVILPLEQRFATPQPMPERVDGIVVLGGAIDTLVSAGRGLPGVDRAGERLMALPGLAAAYPRARIVYSGGSSAFRNEPSEANHALALLTQFGVERERIEIEGRSLNTWQNAVYSREMAAPQPGETWLLVTSAAHMPRAIGTFRKAGWPGIMAYPVDWETSGTDDRWRWFSSASQGLTRLDQGVREWIGLLAYWLTGRSAAVFPAP